MGNKIIAMKINEVIELAEKNRNDKMSTKNSIEQRAVKVKRTRLGRRLKKRLNVRQINEATTQQLEKHIPLLAKVATTRAYRHALASGSRVLIAEAGELKEVSPDGTVRNIKRIEPSVKMRKGQIIEIK